MGFFRVGELSVGSGNSVGHAIVFEDVTCNEDSIEICLASSKTDQFGRGDYINFKAK